MSKKSFNSHKENEKSSEVSVFSFLLRKKNLSTLTEDKNTFFQHIFCTQTPRGVIKHRGKRSDQIQIKKTLFDATVPRKNFQTPTQRENSKNKKRQEYLKNLERTEVGYNVLKFPLSAQKV